MIDHLTVGESCVHVHVSQGSLRTTKSFTHGAVVFDCAGRTAKFGKLPPVAVPEGFPLEDGVTLTFQLVGPDGKLRRQTRSGTLKADKIQPGILRIAGMIKTPSKFSPDDGWQCNAYKFRAYISPPGNDPIGDFPEWIKASATRQRSFWNRLAYLCREARRKCSPLPIEEIITFVRGTILPAIDMFNEELGRSREKMRHPQRLKTEMPGFDGIWSIIQELRKRIEKGRPAPRGLLEKVVAFAEQHKPDYTPLKEFLGSFSAIAEHEAKQLELLRFEKGPMVKSFEKAIRRRETVKAAWSEGWPQLRYADQPKSGDWAIHYYLNKAGVDSSLLEKCAGIPGLSFGPALHPQRTGHPNLKGLAAKRALRPAHISIVGYRKERWEFDFAVLQHRALPANAHIKEWKLLYQDGKLWLCLVLELQRTLPKPQPMAAGLDIGWRRTDAGIRFGTLYEPAGKTIKELIVDLQMSSSAPECRGAFRIDFGPDRWVKRNILRVMPDWKHGDPYPNSFEVRLLLTKRRSELLNAVKEQLRSHCGECLPTWISNVGRPGMMKIHEQLKDDPTALRIFDEWLPQDAQLAELIRMYSRRATSRLVYGQMQVAHDVCRYLQNGSITRLLVKKSFVAAVSQNQENAAPLSLKRSQRYRQFVSPGRFVTLLQRTAKKYAIAVEESDAFNTTRICHHCNHLNAGTEREWFRCGQCGRMIQQDHNAAINLSRLGTDPSLTCAAQESADG
jgi:hypothetical protein